MSVVVGVLVVSLYHETVVGKLQSLFEYPFAHHLYRKTVKLSDLRGGVVYGSPWSGKTPCYRNVSVPIGGIVRLSQAPYNKIRRLKGIEAYVDLAESVGGKIWDSRIAEGLHQTENTLASTIPMWHLECLPDEDAARLCHDTITR